LNFNWDVSDEEELEVKELQILELIHFLFFLCFVSVQNYETDQSARRKNIKAFKKKQNCLEMHAVWVWNITKKKLFHLSATPENNSSKCKIENVD
jgi:hypothetical protein